MSELVPLHADAKKPGAFSDAGALADGATLTADVVIIGSGAGGAVTASAARSRPASTCSSSRKAATTRAPTSRCARTSSYPMLYQESGARATKDLGVTILQGRAVGGTTVVNWTTSFRTPERVYAHWKQVHAVGEIA